MSNSSHRGRSISDMQKTAELRRELERLVGKLRWEDLQCNPYFVFLLGPEFQACIDPNESDPGLVGGHKRSVIKEDLEEDYEVLTGEALQQILEECDPDEMGELPAHAQEEWAMKYASAIVIIPTAYGSCSEISQIAAGGELVCGRTLVLQLDVEAVTGGYSHSAVEHAGILGAEVKMVSLDMMRQCSGVAEARAFADKMHKRHAVRKLRNRNV